MQNFTLGKKGISMLFFAFFLLIGSSPSFGQACPTPDGTPGQQNFCFLETVGDIETDGDAVFQTNSPSDTQPIPDSEILDSGSYFVGSSTGSCQRIEVVVTVAATQYPDNTLYPGSTSFSISPCLNTDFSTEDLVGFFTPLDNYEIRVYEEEFSVTETSGQLTPDESYFVGQVYVGQDSESANCPSLRVAVGYNPANAPAPIATSPQVFCEGATIADLLAEGTSPFTQAIRWYRTSDSFQSLSETTELIDGQTYYASQIINDRNDPFPPCESATRTPVTVTVQQPVDLGTPTQGIICESDVQTLFPSEDEIRKYYLALLPDGTPTDGTLNPTAAQLATIYQNDEDGLGDFTTVYTVGVDGCESSVELTATIVAEEEATAGTIEDIVVDCEDDTIVILDDSLLSEDATIGGTFTGEGVNEDGNFDPAIGPGTYTITYSVDDSADCVIEGTSDSTTFDITVQGPELGEPIVLEMCIIEVQEMLSNPTQAEAFFNNILADNGITNFDGTFNPSEDILGTLILTYINSNPTAPETFNNTYTVTTNCGEESIDITLTINNSEEPNAGPINPAPVCASATPFDLFSLLSEGNDMDGTFSDENGVIENGSFDVSEMGTFPITYTVTESAANCTAGEPDSTEFTLTVSEGIVAENPAPVFVCAADVQTLFPSEDEIRKFYIAIAVQAGFPGNGTINPNQGQLADNYQADEDGLGDFTTTYTFGEGDCQTSVELTVTIVESADAGENGSVTLTTEDDAVNLFDYLGGTPMEGGTWSNGNGLFDPSTDEEGVFTYNVTIGSCEDSATVTVTVEDETIPTEPGCAGEDVNIFICEAQVAYYIANPNEAAEFFASIIAPSVDQSGTFTPTLESIAAQWAVNPVGTFISTYSINNDDCVDSAVITIVVSEGDQIVRDPVNSIICESDVQALFPSNDEIRKYYLSLVPAGISRTGGTFSPNAAQLAALYQADEDGLGEFATTYTVQDGECSVSVLLTATIVAEEEATTGDIEDFEICVGEGTINLNDRLTDANTPGGVFSTENGVLTNGVFDTSETGAYVITYTVSEDDAETCLSGSASTTFTVTVGEGDLDAGADNSIEVCNSDVRNLNETGVRNLYLGLLEDGVPTNGTFEPTILELITQYNLVSNYGDFTTTYTIGEGDCSDSAILTVTVIEANDAGADMDLSFCATEGPVNLFDFLSPYATTNGTFEGLTNGMFDPSSATIGETVITYEVEDDESVCSTGNFTATFTINVSEPTEANAGGDQTPPAYCVTDARDIALVSLLGEGANTFGSFEIDGEEITSVNPAELGIGEFVIIYSIDENDCAIGTDSATITITVTATPDAPVANANQSFCLIDNPTVANIVATGENVIIYLDEALTEEATGTNPLANDAVYYAAATNNGCKSEGVMITIELSDGTAPTLQTEGNEFCRSDNPTIQDLINNLSGSGIQIYQASTGGTALATSTALVDGTTYFASGTDSTSQCESSERTAIQVEVAFCGIPEAFSPNGDNINDRFVIPDIAIDFPNYTIEIFNRWGNVVFKGNSSTGDWNGVSNQSGTLGDNVLAAGVYFYILNYNDGQTAPIQGKVYLSR